MPSSWYFVHRSQERSCSSHGSLCQRLSHENEGGGATSRSQFGPRHCRPWNEIWSKWYLMSQQPFRCQSHIIISQISACKIFFLNSYTAVQSQRVFYEERNQDSNSLETLSIQPHVLNPRACETKFIFLLKLRNYWKPLARVTGSNNEKQRYRRKVKEKCRPTGWNYHTNEWRLEVKVHKGPMKTVRLPWSENTPV